MRDVDEQEACGSTATERHEVVRWRYGRDSGETFATGEDFDGFTLTIECGSRCDADAMIAAISNQSN